MTRRLSAENVSTKMKRKGRFQPPGHQIKFIPACNAQIQKLKEANGIGRRRKLVLPNVQVNKGKLLEGNHQDQTDSGECQDFGQ